MEPRAIRITKGVVLLAGIMAAVFLMIWGLAWFTAFLADYVRRLVLAINDEAPSADNVDEREGRPGQRPSSQGGGGLDKAAIEMLPLVVYGRHTAGAEDDPELPPADAAAPLTRALAPDCGVCLADFQEMESLRLLPACQHCFHPSCIDAWLSSHTTCPLCRQPLLLTAIAVPASPASPPAAVHRDDDDPRRQPFSIINMNDLASSPPAGGRQRARD